MIMHGDRSKLTRLPTILSDRPFPGESFRCALSIFERCNLRADQSVAIIGIGFLGSALTGLASREEARVIVVLRRSFARDMAIAFGATEVTRAIKETKICFKSLRPHKCSLVRILNGFIDLLTIPGVLRGWVFQ